ncbi:MAG TPA: hypothetical protein VKM72_09605 [Thermoanaerobaculia bacterium]|nr:hypothetical protein [Thermoanaerobaculia bacterium]
MSGTLKIRFGPDMPAASVEVVAPDLGSVGQLWLGAGQDKEIQVPSEGSFLRVHLPSGEIVTLEDPGNLDRLITLSDIMRHIRRPARTELTPVRRRSAAELRQLTLDVISTRSAPIVEALEVTAFKNDVQVSLGTRGGNLQPSVVREPGASVIYTPPWTLQPYELTLQLPGRRVLVHLPGTLEEVVVRADEVEGHRRVVTVRATTTNDLADAIGSYMQRGDLHAAAAMTDWAEHAEDLLEAKMGDPFAATIGAYLLLRLRRFDLMHDWTRNLADRFSDIVDGAVIRAWHLIHAKGDATEIQALLQRAFDSALPVFTEGLRLLNEGAQLLGNSQATAKLNQKSGIVLWSSPFTTTVHGTPAEGSARIDFDVDYASRI